MFLESRIVIEMHVLRRHDFWGDSCNVTMTLSKGCMVTLIGAVLTAETGDTMRSPGHGGFFPLGHGVTTVFRGIS